MTDDQKAPVQPASVVGLIGRKQSLQERHGVRVFAETTAGMRYGEWAGAGYARLAAELPPGFVACGHAVLERINRQLTLAYKIADESAVSLLESSLLHLGDSWLDTATAEPADDPAILEAIEYLELRGMLERDPDDLALVRAVEQGGASHD